MRHPLPKALFLILWMIPFATGCSTLFQRTAEISPKPFAKAPLRQPFDAVVVVSDADALKEAQKNAEKARINGEATAEYHFSMAQAYVAEGNSDRAIEEYKLTLMFDPKSALVNTRLATEYVKKGMLAEAMESCKAALVQDPKFVEARLMLAGLHSASHEDDQALREYDTVLKQDPTHEEAVVYKSQILTEKGDATAAIKTLRHFLVKTPDSALVWYYLGRAEQRDERFKDAVAAYLHALKTRPGFSQASLALASLYEARQNNGKAIQIYKDVYDQSQDLTAANRLATIYLKQEKYQEAVPYLEAIEANDSEDMNARVKLGLIYMELKNFDKAIALFKQILEKNPEADRVHYYLGSLYEETKQPDLAIAELKKVSVDSKLYSETSLHVAYMMKQSGNSAGAKAFVTEAMTKSPRVVNFYIFLASLEEEGKALSSATQILENATQLFPDDEKVRYYLGSLYDRIGDTQKSLKQMEAILRTNPDNVDALNYIGYTWTQQGVRLNDAEKLIRHALVLKPDNGYVQDSWGWYLLTRGRLAEAVVELEKAAMLKPNEATILEHLGDAYLRSNLREKAASKYGEAIRFADDATIKQKISGKLENLKEEIAKRGASSTDTARSPASR